MTEVAERKGPLPGHTLPWEGRVEKFGGLSNGPGRGRCSCGERSSEPFQNTAQRKKWHRQHKAEVAVRRAGSEPTRGDAVNLQRKT